MEESPYLEVRVVCEQHGALPAHLHEEELQEHEGTAVLLVFGEDAFERGPDDEEAHDGVDAYLEEVEGAEEDFFEGERTFQVTELLAGLGSIV